MLATGRSMLTRTELAEEKSESEDEYDEDDELLLNDFFGGLVEPIVAVAGGRAGYVTAGAVWGALEGGIFWW